MINVRYYKIVQSTTFLRVEARPMDFNVREHEKFIDTISDSTFATNFKIFLMLSFNIVSKKNIQSYLKRQLKDSSLFQSHICVDPDFLHVFQPKQRIARH